ncbi:MAG: NAD(P)-binding protein [Gemmatimonadetes bacterium]|nr:NAD(P)-binding protein [Gemmatimonadota bacterium]
MSSSRSAPPPIRVAIVGGGCASLTAAWELTRPEQQGRYAVTVFQQGWRLGGKGASGRGPSDRIEEHGLHLWMGFYENAFGMMRACYRERAADPATTRLATFEEAFAPAPLVGVADRTPNDSAGWESWLAAFPAGRGLPGDPLEQGTPFSVIAYLRQSVMLVRALLRAAHAAEEREAMSAGGIADLVARAVRYGELAAVTALFEAADALRHAMDAWVPGPAKQGATVLLQLLDVLAMAARGHLQRLAEADTEMRRVWQVIDLILAAVRGSVMHGLAADPRGFDAINDWDWREWLRLHGASDASLDSGFMRGIYDLAFAYEDGDVTRPRLAAGVALRGAMRMFFTYRGSLFWRMNAGMGDVVFAPLYQVLKARGVRFEFFHRLTNVGLAEDGASVETLAFDVQARVRGTGRPEYAPLVQVRQVPCWPSEPNYTQLVDGDRLRREGRRFESHWDRRGEGTRSLRVGDDFDFVVLGVSVSALPQVAPALIAASTRWRDMIQHVKTVPTQALQLWMSTHVKGLGWPHPGEVNLSGFVEPFDTWADMTHLIPEEGFSARVKSVAYFCSVLPDRPDAEQGDEDFPMKRRAFVRDNAVTFIERDLPILWPRLRDAKGRVRWEWLVPGDGAPRRTSDAIDGQYWTANVNPTDRYVLSLPGSPRYRLSPLDATFDNLTIAGDWTATGLDSGCIESAVISGRLASHALSQFPPLADIVGYDHP